MTRERWQQIQNLYHAVHESGPDVLIAADSDLRKEVERLLAADSDGTILERPLPIFFESDEGIRLNTGSRLGPYRIEEVLGSGGMGCVYRATDTRLNRTVAIKVVPEEFSTRFEREARSISSLNHPHICTLYDVGPNYLILELISGNTLSECLKKGPLPIEQTIRYGIQIADALAAAHAHGIIHRDLKPGNIMISKAGIKIFDFGIARSDADDKLTTTGMVIGTPAYMAPEQSQGGPVDARTDIYALGLVLYEMALGRRPPPSQPPPMPGLARELAHIIERCLMADPSERWQAVSDVRAELAWASTPPVIEKRASPKSRWLWIFAGVCTFAVAIGLTSLWMVTKGEVTRDVAQFPFIIAEAGDEMPLISPDGRYMAFAGTDEGGKKKLFTRAANASHPRSLPGTENATVPMWSPDSQWIAFFVSGRLKKVRPEGGPIETIADLPGFQEGSWGSRGDIVFRPSNREPLFVLRSSGGIPTPVTRLDSSLTENSHRSVQFLPDGHRFLYFARCAEREHNALYLGSIDSTERKLVARMDANALYLSPTSHETGKLLYYQGGALLVQPFDVDAARLTGDPKMITNEVAFNAASALAFFSASSDGRWILVRPPGAVYTHLQWFDRRGQVLETLPIEGELSQPRLSPSGDRLMFSRPDGQDGNRDLWAVDLSRGIVSPLTVDPANDWWGVWSPNGREVLFNSDRRSSPKLSTYIKRSLEPGADEYPTTLPGDPFDWSLDGNWFVFGSDDIIAASAKDLHSFPYLATRFHESGARFSPDAKWLAYSSDESGEREVYVRPFDGAPAGAGKIQISADGGDFPVWRRDGRELFFMSADQSIYSVDLSKLSSLHTVGPSAKLFRACSETMPAATAGTSASYFYAFDTRDGNRFLVDCRVSAPGRFVVLLNAIVK